MAAGSDADGKAQQADGPGAAAEGGDWEEEAQRITRFPKSTVSRTERDQMVKQAREVKFPVSVRGYERAAVDRYVREVNRVIAELEISSSSESAVRHALAEVSEETREILQRAHETADEIVLRARAKAADAVESAEREADAIRNAAEQDAIEARESAAHEAEELIGGTRREAGELRAAAEGEAAELRMTAGRDAEGIRAAANAEADKLLRSTTEKAEQLLKSAETRARKLVDSADLIWRERRRLIEDVRVVGEQLLALGEEESRRFARPTTASALAASDSHEPEAPDTDLTAELHAAVEGHAQDGR